jgi:hypothetical protein
MVAVVIGSFIGFGGSDSPTAPVTDAQAEGLPPVDEVIKRVEAIRGLKFKTRPRVRLVRAKDLEGELKRVEIANARKARNTAERSKQEVQGLEAASVLVTTLTGIIDPERDPELIGEGKQTEGTTRGNAVGVAGLYVPETKTVYVVREIVADDPREGEAVLAHELVHALEDQSFGGFKRNVVPFADSSTAHHALAEGSATLAEVQYRIKHLGSKGPADRVLGGVEKQTTDPAAPPGVNVLQSFPYVGGGKFAADLHREGGWKVVDKAHDDPPKTTSAVLHPDEWPNEDTTTDPRFSIADALGADWGRLGRADLGEVDTLAVLRSGLSEEDAAKAADGWRAGRFEAWVHRSFSKNCKPPCRRDTAAVLVWRMRSDDDAEELVDGLEEAIPKATRGKAEDDGILALKGGAAATLQRGRIVVLAFAPTGDQAKALAEATPREE